MSGSAAEGRIGVREGSEIVIDHGLTGEREDSSKSLQREGFNRFRSRAVLHLAGIGHQHTGQEIDERRLACAIGADKAEPVAAPDTG